MTRRTFVGTAAASAASPLMLIQPEAKPRQNFKSMRAAELLKRTGPEIYRGAELRYIGMPVGGLFAGTVYLGGDGQLWNWDVFNQHHVGTVPNGSVTFMGDQLNEIGGSNYVEPPRQQSPFGQVFELVTNGRVVKFGDIAFRGEYPVGKVTYQQADAEVEMSLTAFSPFCPLDVESSSFPATTMTYRVTNVGQTPAEYRLRYRVNHPVLCHSRKLRSDFQLETRSTALGGIEFFAAAKPQNPAARPDIKFEDWSTGTYGKWVATGTAFSDRPRKVSDLPTYMGPVHAGTEFVVNSHQNRSGEDVVAADNHTGELVSPTFKVERNYINLRVGGGSHAGKTCINLTSEGKILRSVTGRESNVMEWTAMDVKEWIGKPVRLEVIDHYSGGWGQISLGEVIFSDTPAALSPINELGDFGTFAVEVVGTKPKVEAGEAATVSVPIALNPGETKEVTFVVAWHFPNASPQLPAKTNWYATRWTSAAAVAADLTSRWPALRDVTLAWNATWYDSTLPHWFLDRTFLNLGTLATTTCHRFADGRFYFWEGIGCCAGTCTHVWGYAQAIGRVFPEVERFLREKIDFGMAFHAETGQIDYRAEYHRIVAHDGQCGCILRALREHQMSPNDGFLKRIWPQVKRATEFLISEDKDENGILETAQYNTLDAAWWGKIAWISSLYVAALRASEVLAREMRDVAFADRCAKIAAKGSENLVSELYNGEYFIHLTDPAHPESNNTNVGCHIDQLFGQSWAWQVGLPRIVPQKHAVSALKALYKYSFWEDVWEYRRHVKGIPGGRWYATPGEGGLVMCSFPRGGAANSVGKGSDAWAVGYFNECMSGFEHQVVAHMLAEGMVTEGLSVLYAIHDRYHATRRNPYNEIECSDHYGRAMASYGAYVSIAGFEVNGPRHEMKFAPRVKGRFRGAFINEQGWGTYDQSSSGEKSVTYRYRVPGVQAAE